MLYIIKDFISHQIVKEGGKVFSKLTLEIGIEEDSFGLKSQYETKIDITEFAGKATDLNDFVNKEAQKEIDQVMNKK